MPDHARAGDDDHGDEQTYSLVMPFVVCESEGGPYDDNAYAAGFEAGNLAVNLVLNRSPFNATVHTENVPQLDLLAMRHGWAARIEEASEGWSYMHFTKAEVIA